MRSVLVLCLALASVTFLQGAGAQGATMPDAWVTLGPDTLLENDPAGILELLDSSDARWTWNLTLTKPFTVIEFQGRDLGLDRPRQLVPILDVPEDRYPLFHLYPNERVWEADAPAQVFHVTGDGDAPTLRIGVPGPANHTLVLEVDAVAPAFDLGEPQNVTHIGFYMETQTAELALADLQVRETGATEWVQNPTTEYHVLQRFPVQGLDADKEHEAQVVFEDWAGNVATSPTFRVRTLPAPAAALVVVRPVSPAPNSTLESGESVVVRATMESAAEIPREGVRLFFDLKEITDFEAHGADLLYTPPSLASGLHRVNLEVTDAEGGFGRAAWSFTVGGSDTPFPAIAWIIGALLAVAGTRRASRRA